MSVPTTKVVACTSEYTVNALLQPDVATPISGDWVRHFRTHTESSDVDGWIDVRGFTRMNILVTPGGQPADYTVEFREGSNDPRTQALPGSTQAGVVAGTTTTLYQGQIEYISHIRVIHNKNGATAGTSAVSVLLK